MLRSSITLQLMSRLMLVMISVAIVIQFAGYKWLSAKSYDQFQHDMETQLHMINSALEEAAYTYDFQQIQNIVDSLVGTSMIASIKVTDHRGKIMGEALDEDSEAARLVARTGVEISKNDKVIGMYDIAFSTKAKKSALFSTFIFGLVLVLGMVAMVMVTVFYLVRKQVVAPVNDVTKRLKKIADGGGDLASRLVVRRRDEIGRLCEGFNQVLEQISAVIKNVVEVNTKVAQSVEGMTAASAKTASNLNLQLAEIEQVASAFSRLNSAAEDVSFSAKETAERTYEVNQTAEEGARVVQRSRTSISRLTEQIQSTAQKIVALKDSSEDIGSVMQVISTIAEQTNLLALNAAIEAARAGEQGRGFAVVADEVRTLAQKTQDSTEEIGNIISRLQHDADEVHQAMSLSVDSVSESLETSKKVEESLHQVAESIATINDMNQKIASGAQEQSDVSSDVTQIVNRIYQISEDVVKDAQIVEQNSSDLRVESEELNRQMSKFKL